MLVLQLNEFKSDLKKKYIMPSVVQTQKTNLWYLILTDPYDEF